MTDTIARIFGAAIALVLFLAATGFLLMGIRFVRYALTGEQPL